MDRSCDVRTGACAPFPELLAAAVADGASLARGIVYVGDPMCSWCWGISRELGRLRDHAEERGIGFAIAVGGLRPGGGEAWTASFKSFLRHHWEEVGILTGQPFSFALLARESYRYDTEPPCRAVVVARAMLRERGTREGRLFEFFSAIQEKFYVKGEDPALVSFYESLCTEHDLSFPGFCQHFADERAKAATVAEFALCRRWGVNAFPTVLFCKNGVMHRLASGFATGEAMIEAVCKLV